MSGTRFEVEQRELERPVRGWDLAAEPVATDWIVDRLPPKRAFVVVALQGGSIHRGALMEPRSADSKVDADGWAWLIVGRGRGPHPVVAWAEIAFIEVIDPLEPGLPLLHLPDGGMSWYQLDREQDPPEVVAVQAGRFDHDIVRHDTFGELLVSTVFLALDHQHRPNGPRQVFETQVFNRYTFDPVGDFHVRYATWTEAVEGHHRAAAAVWWAAFVNRKQLTAGADDSWSNPEGWIL